MEELLNFQKGMVGVEKSRIELEMFRTMVSSMCPTAEQQADARLRQAQDIKSLAKELMADDDSLGIVEAMKAAKVALGY